MKKLILIFAFTISWGISSQIAEDDNWDNNLNVSQKIAYGTTEWKHTAEFQTRFLNNSSNLDLWFIEYAATYLASENWEIVPDFRYSRKPTRTEIRPGIGAIYKILFDKSQLAHQVKYQYDIRNGVAPNSHGLRYAVFYNYVFNEKIIVSAIGGAIFEFSEVWDGFLGVRTGFAAAYVFNKAHSLNIGYFYGLINEKTNDYTNIGILSIQLIININKDYKYLPAKYINL